MLFSRVPFPGDDEDEIYDAILAGDPSYQDECPNKDAVDIMQGLLNPEPKNRLGSNRDAEEVMAHPFFAHVRWDQLSRKQTDPPMRPGVKSDADTDFFEKEYTRETPLLPALDQESRSFTLFLRPPSFVLIPLKRKVSMY